MKNVWMDTPKINAEMAKLMASFQLHNGTNYRAVTGDGDIVDGTLVYWSEGKFELQTGSGYRSFNRSWTKIIQIKDNDNN